MRESLKMIHSTQIDPDPDFLATLEERQQSYEDIWAKAEPLIEKYRKACADAQVRARHVIVR